MARWKNPGHTMFAFVILGRIAEISEEGIFTYFVSANRVSAIDEWLRKINGN